MKNFIKKYFIYIIVIFVFIISFFAYKYKIKAENNYDNQIEVYKAVMTKIETGNGNFSETDGLTYGDNGSIISFNSGEDSSSDNRIVRSFDTVTYYFDVGLKGKTNDNFYTDRKITIDVELTDEEAKFISFDPNIPAKDKTYTFEYNNIDSSETSLLKLTLYVLNAENNKEIAPKFTINESTNKDNGVILGKISSDVYNYEFINGVYQNKSNVSDFTNYMPTYTSSADKNLKVISLGSLNEAEKTTYNDKKGRYVSSIIAIALEGNNSDNYKGVHIDVEDINLDLKFSQSSNDNIIFDKAWVQNYTKNSYNSFLSVFPYSPLNFGSSYEEIRNAGDITVSNIDNEKYTLTISNINPTYNSPTTGSDGSNLNSNYNYLGTYLISAFSPRTSSSGQNDIDVIFEYTDIKQGNNLLGNLTDYGKNSYFVDTDSNFYTEFYDSDGTTPLKKDGPHGTSSAPKGKTVTYKTTFTLKDLSNNTGFKEYIKIDERAFRLLSMSDKEDIKIESNCSTEECKKIFENLKVSFLSGNFLSENYEAINYDQIDNRITVEDKDIVKDACTNVSNDLNNYTNNQIMNLYGSPCIKPKLNTEKVFSKISDSKDEDDNEIPISKILIETKEKVKLPEDITFSVLIKLRVRNVSDITKTYQVVSNITSSDYDDDLIYYAPRVNYTSNSITNPDNYLNTIYEGQNYLRLDSNLQGDSLKIINFKVNSNMSVKNKNKDGTQKTNYNVIDNETIVFCVSTTIEDYGIEVGEDDNFFINNLNIEIVLPDTLDYIQDSSLGLPSNINENRYLYTLPFTKPNRNLKNICIKTKLSNKITEKSVGEEITVKANTQAININGEIDNSLFSNLTSSFTINATGIRSVITSLENGNDSSLVDKNQEFSYKLKAYNNSGSEVTDYVIMNILPRNGDENSSEFEGNYKVKINFDNSTGSFTNAKFYCSTMDSLNIANEVFNENNDFKECNINNDFVFASAIRITGIKISKDSDMDDITLTIKPENNNYGNKYVNSFIGGSKILPTSKSNKIDVSIINRSIGGKAFYDINEDGIRNDNEGGIKDLPVTLYSLKNGVLSKIKETTTNENGEYIFDKLDKGNYKVQISYDKSKYDVARRYATEDTDIDSDAYKIEEGLAEISNKKSAEEKDGITLSSKVLEAKNMDLGLIPLVSLGFEMKKYITQIDLNYNNLVTTNYYNDSKVLLNVRNSLQATARVYYGISITNTSLKAGYVRLVEEDIPEGLIFNKNDEYNSDWFEVGSVIQSATLSNIVINPGETKYLKIVLDMPKREEAGIFINNASVLDIEEYEPPILSNEYINKTDTYSIGDRVAYAGYNWHVIKTVDNENEQILTLFMDNKELTSKELSTESTYKWSTSSVNTYLNDTWEKQSSINSSILYDTSICDDQSGLVNTSYGGNIDGICTSNVYRNSKIRLLTENEFNYLNNLNLTDKSFIYGEYWLMNASDEIPTYDVYGKETNSSISSNAKYANNGSIFITNAKTIKDIRPVITISNKNIISD